MGYDAFKYCKNLRSIFAILYSIKLKNEKKWILLWNI